MNTDTIKPGDVVCIKIAGTNKPMLPEVYGLVVAQQPSPDSAMSGCFWHCLWSNGMSSDIYGHESELMLVQRAVNT
jgi:hypothetical protein